MIAGALFATPGAAFAASAASAVAPASAIAPASAAAGSTSASAAPAISPNDGVTLAVSPAGAGVLTAGADLPVSVEIANPGQDLVGEGTVTLSFDPEPLTGADQTAWLAATDGLGSSGQALTMVLAAPAASVQAGTVHTLQLSIPAALLQGASGVHGLQAGLSVGGQVITTARTTISVDDGTTLQPPVAEVTVVAPLTTPASAGGLLSSDALTALTAENGELTRELDAVVDRPVTLAVDPRIIVSIRALGSTAPASAVSWLTRLNAASNPVIPLTYGDSDIAGEHQAGAPGILAPTSFAYALDPTRFTNVGELIEPSPSAGSDPAPTPAAGAPAAPAVPSTQQLLSWNWTSTAVAWPRAGSLEATDLPFFAASGLTTSLVGSAEVAHEDGSAVTLPDAVASVGADTVLVADDAVSAAVQGALTADTDARRGQALAQLAGAVELSAAQATDTGTESGTPRQILALVDRGTTDLDALGQVLATIEGLPSASTGSLQTLLALPATQTLTVTSSPEPTERLSRISGLFLDLGRIDAFSSVLAQPELLTGRQRADLLALLSNSWTADDEGWTTAVQDEREGTAKTLDSVQVVEGSNINLLSNQAPLPVTLSNELPYPVTVVLHVTPSNGRLVVEETDVPVTLEASSRKGAQIPVTAVANGSVTLNYQLLSPSGVLISTPAPVDVNVSADWETWGTVIGGALLVALFGVGLVRNILRRRKTRAEAEAAAETSPDDGGAHE